MQQTLIQFARALRARFRAALPLLAAAMALGCGGGGEGDGAAEKPKGAGNKSLRIFDTGIEAVNKKMWEEAIADFKAAHPEVDVEIKVMKDDDYSQGGGLIAALRGKNPPDIYFEWAWAAVARDASNGNARDLTPLITPEFRATLDPRSWQGTDHDGKTYMIPVAFDLANLLYYNKKILGAHSIAPPKTWEEFIEACKKLRAAGVNPIMHGNQMAWPAGNWASEIAVCYLGLEDFKKAGTKPQQVKLTDPRFAQAVGLMKQLADIKAFNADINTLNDNEGQAKFAAGEGAFIFTGGWALDILGANGGAEVFGAIARPKLPGNPASDGYLLANSTGYMINSKCAEPELAFDMLVRLLKPGPQVNRVKGGLNSTLIEAQKQVESQLQKDVLDALGTAEVWVAAPDISWERATAERFYEAVKEVIGGADPAAALEAAQKDVDAALR